MDIREDFDEEEEKLAPLSSLLGESHSEVAPDTDTITKDEPENTNSQITHEEAITVVEPLTVNDITESEVIKDEPNH